VTEEVKCPICSTKFLITGTFDPCPYCEFEYEGGSDFYNGIENVKDSEYAPSYNEAKANVAKGLNAYGDEPLPKIRPPRPMTYYEFGEYLKKKS
jgi:hypothetical protein